MTDQGDIASTAAAERPTTNNETSGSTWDIVKAQKRYAELTTREMDARVRATLEARGQAERPRRARSLR